MRSIGCMSGKCGLLLIWVSARPTAEGGGCWWPDRGPHQQRPPLPPSLPKKAEGTRTHLIITVYCSLHVAFTPLRPCRDTKTFQVGAAASWSQVEPAPPAPPAASSSRTKPNTDVVTVAHFYLKAYAHGYRSARKRTTDHTVTLLKTPKLGFLCNTSAVHLYLYTHASLWKTKKNKNTYIHTHHQPGESCSRVFIMHPPTPKKNTPGWMWGEPEAHPKK